MTVSNTQARQIYTCNGVTTVRTVPFRILDETHLRVVKYTIATGAVVDLVLNTDYQVTDVGAANATFTTIGASSPFTSAYKLIALRNVPLSQAEDYVANDSFPAESHEEALDKVTMALQQQADVLSRSASFGEFAATNLTCILPTPVDGYGIVWDGVLGTLRNTTVSMSTLEDQAAALYAIRADITIVAGIDSDVTAVASNETDISTVAAISAAVSIVAGIAGSVTSVASNASNINTVAAQNANITTLASISGSITTVAGISAQVTTVAGLSTQVTGVYNIRTDVTTVAGISGNVTTVAGISANVTSVAGNATNINTVASNSTNINTVAAQNANITTLAGISANITTVAGISANVTTVATNSASVVTVATNITDVVSAANALDSAMKFTFSTTTAMADPGTGLLRFNNATPASVTAIAIDDLSAQTGNPDLSTFIISWDDSTASNKGTLRITKGSSPSTFAIYTITGLTDNVGWSQLAVTYVTGNGSFSASDNLYLSYTRTGDNGATGAAGSLSIANAAGTADAITADFSPDLTLADNLVIQVVNTAGANTITNPTLNTDGSGALTIKARGNAALVAGDTGLAGYTMTLRYEQTGTYWELQNPAANISIVASSEASDTTCFPAFLNAASGAVQQLKYNSSFGFNASTVALTCTTFIGALTGNASTATALATTRAIYGNNFDGSAALTQIIASTYGGTGNGFTKFSGPLTAEKTFTLPNASCTVLTDNAAVTVAQGGTGLATLTANNVLIGNGTGNVTFVAPGTSGNVLTSNGTTWASTAPASQMGGATETASGSVLTLTASSNRVQAYAPSAAGLYVKLPDATTMTAGGIPFIIKNTGTHAFPVIDAGTPGQAIAYLQPGDGCMLYCSNISTAKGKWYAGAGDMGNMTEVLNGVTSQSVAGETANNNQAIAVAPISATTFLLVWQNNVATISLRCAVITMSNADTLSAGAVASIVSLASLSGFAACALDASNVAVGYHGTSVTSIVVIGISGTTATPGTPTSIVATTSGNMHLFKISSTSVFCGYVTSTTSKGVVISAMSTAGNTINSVTTCRASTTTEGNLTITQADVNTYFYATCGTTSFGDAQLVTVSSVTVTANTALANFSTSIAVAQLQTIALSTTLFLTMYQQATNMCWVVHRVSTGTTLEVWAGGNTNTLRAGNTPYGLGAVTLNSYAVFLWNDTSAGVYGCLMMDFFKFNATTRAVSYSHSVKGDVANVYNYGRSGNLKVSAGKVACGTSGITGASSGVFLLHGIENP